MKVHVKKPITTKNAGRTFDYIQRAAVWSFGPSREEITEAARGTKAQARHLIISPDPKDPEAHNLEKMQRNSQRTADHWRRRGFLTVVALHAGKDGAYHAHLLVTGRDREGRRLHLDALELNKYFLRTKKIFGDNEIPDGSRERKPQRRDRTGRGKMSAARFRALDAVTVAELEKEPPDPTKAERDELRDQLKHDREELKKIHGELDQKISTTKWRADQMSGPIAADQTIKPPSLTADEWREHAADIAKAGGLQAWLSSPACPLHIKMRFLADATKTANPPLYFSVIEERELTALAGSVATTIKRRDHLRARIEEATQRRAVLLDDAFVFNLDQTLVFFGPLQIRAVKKDKDGTPKAAKVYDIETHDQARDIVPLLRKKNSEGTEIYFAPKNKERYISLDDLTAEQVKQLPRGAWIIRTSTKPDNHTAFLKLDTPSSHDERVAVARFIGSDLAHHSGGSRLAGYKNHKRGGVLVARLSTTHGVISKEALLRAINFQSPERPKPAPLPDLPRQDLKKSWNDFDRGDPSGTDFSFALYLLRQGLTVEEAAALLEEQSPSHNAKGKARAKSAEYWMLTTEKAAAIIAHTGRKTEPRDRGRGRA